MDLEKKIKTIALKNAVKYDGEANKGSVVSALLGDHPELKQDMAEITSDIDNVLDEVNSLSLDEQEALLKEVEPSFFEEDEEKSIFARYDIEGDVKTAFPPAPEKYPHIGHAYALFINYQLAKENDGEFIIRFEDTNPAKVEQKYYSGMIEDFEWLGIEWDDVTYASDFMDVFMEKAEEGIQKGFLYMCNCSGDAISDMRESGEGCACKQNDVEKNQNLWEEFKEGDLPEYSLRIDIGMDHENSAMRDPVLFRHVGKSHCRHGKKYQVWPTYDFQNSILDGEQEITHRFRSKEFEMRDELHTYIQEKYGYEPTTIFEFARFEMEDTVTSGRVIREKIQNDEFDGWDDPRLTTLKGLRRRGFQPEAIKEFLLGRGISKTESTVTWNDLIVENRRYLDDKADRLYMIQNPLEIDVDGLNEPCRLDSHPDRDDASRQLTIADTLLIEEDDYESLEEGKLYRLKGYCNVIYEGDTLVFDSTDLEKYKEEGEKALHFLPPEDTVEASLLMDDGSERDILVEKNVDMIEEGEVIQFERFGFARLDSENPLYFVFTH